MGHERIGIRNPPSVERRHPIGVLDRVHDAPATLSPTQKLRQRVGNQGTIALLYSLTAASADRAMAGGRENSRAERSFAPVGSVGYLPPWIQMKLTISRPGDVHEQEADRVADQLMRMPDANLSVAPSPPQVSRKCTACEEEDKKKLQMRSAGALEAADRYAPPIVNEVLRSPGQPLGTQTREFFESRFGQDLSHVRLHSDALAQKSTRQLNAEAYTVGHDIVFGAGRLTPEKHEGRRLLAHELTHVLQQGGRPAPGPGSDSPSAHEVPQYNLMRRVARESTIEICHQVLTSKKFSVKEGGVRVVIMPKQLDTKVPNCQNHKFWVTLNASVDWWFDKEIATCQGMTGVDNTFLFGNIPPGSYYLTISRVFDNPNCCLEGDILIFDELINSDSGACERRESLSAMDIVHGALTIAGFIPVLGAIPDGVNAIIYVAEGDWAGAGLSAVAMVPAWGDGIELGVMGGKSIIKISEKAAVRMGKEGIAKGLKEVKAASKATEEAAKAEKALGKAGKETATEAIEAEKGVVKAEQETTEDIVKAEEAAQKRLAEEAAKKELEKKIEECLAIWAAYKGLKCTSCKATDTLAERAVKIACLTALIAGRREFLKQKCDYVLPGSISRGSAVAERGHMTQLEQIEKMLLKCSTMPTL